MTTPSPRLSPSSTILCSAAWTILATMAAGCASGELLGSEPDSDGPELGTGETFEGEVGGGPDDGGSPSCPEGTVNCPCAFGVDCEVGLECEWGVCVSAPAECGDGLVDLDEECDNGLDNADDAACRSDCKWQVCGDGFVGPGEACDNGDAIDGEGCNEECGVMGCGNTIVEPGEECDDGNDDDSDECLGSCLAATCGDGVVQVGVEQCDDADTNDEDGCSADCECLLTFEDAVQIDGWELEGSWGIHFEAPASNLFSEVPFGPHGGVLGTDGNRSAPYPGGEAEASSATTTPFVFPATLRFASWHVDEGTLIPNGTADEKRILVSVDGGATWDPLVDCAMGPNDDLPFCQERLDSRAHDEWDQIQIDTSAHEGLVGQLRFEYDTVDSCCTFEQGWFLDDFEAFGCS